MDPFQVVSNPSPSAAPTGALGMSPQFWQNLMTFGGAMSQAANARTPQGFLANGTGWQGALGAGILGAEQGARQNAALSSEIAAQRAQAGLTGAQAAVERFQIPYAMWRLQMLENGPPGMATGGIPSSGPLASGVSSVESGGNPQAMNAEGYAGKFQFGTAALDSAGIYKPAKGEDLSKNEWKGQIVLPGQAPMTVQQFLANPQAQSAAFDTQERYLAGQATSLGLTNYIGQTVGGVPITPVTLVAGMHFGGPAATQRFLETGGQFNPADKNGMTLSAYMQHVAAATPQGSGQPSLLPAGMPSPQSLYQKSLQLRQEAAWYSMVGFPDRASELTQQASNYEQAAFQMYKPQYTRQGGLITIPGVGVIRAGTTTHLETPQGTEVPAEEYGPVETPSGVMPARIAPIPVSGARGAQPQPTPMRSPLIGYTPASAPAPAANGGPQTPSGVPGNALPVPPQAPQQPLVSAISPAQEEFLSTRGKTLAEQFNEIDASAAHAVQSNYLFDNLRNDSQSWRMGKFADWQGDARGYLQAFANMFGIQAPQLNQKVADFQAFRKSSGMLLREAVHETSSRAALQEYRMIGDTLPSPENTQQAFGQIADQWQALNDYVIARQKFANAFRGDPQDFNVRFNSDVSPSSFLVNRMMQTAGGEADFKAMVANMSKTEQGRLTLEGMMREYKSAQEMGLFRGLAPIAANPGAAPAAQPVSAPQPPQVPTSG